MVYDYDKLYRATPRALGDPAEHIVAFFARHKAAPLRVLDVGCGQGRDALCIARLGHGVVGVDLSPSGIAEMMAAAKAEALPIEGVVADITRYAPKGRFDAVLCDRTLHMLPGAARLAVLGRLMDAVRPGGWLLIADERANMPGFRNVAAARPERWETERDTGADMVLRRA